MLITKYFVVLVLLFSTISLAFAHPQAPPQSSTMQAKSVVPLQQMSEAKVDKVKLSPTGGQLRFKHKGQFVDGDMSKAKVYMMKAGKRVEIPRSEWGNVLKPGTPMTVTVQRSVKKGLVVIAIIAILIGMLLPAVQKVRG